MNRPLSFHFLAPLCLAGALSIAACGDSTNTTTSTGTSTATNTSTTETTTATSTTTASATTGITGTKLINAISDADKKLFCDWTAGLYGGYGEVRSCAATGTAVARTITGPESQAACLAQNPGIKPTCTMTVAATEACIAALSTCDPTDEATKCPALFACYTNH